ncbi:MAG: hypothetical protein IKD47_05865 [Clostridia bacterium]|nr:hypothetical protein [Clostridia bacterium]
MFFDEKKNRNDVKLYACKAREVTIPALQAELELSAEDAQKYVWELVKEGVMEHSVGFVFRYVGPETVEDQNNKNPWARSSDSTRRSRDFLFDELRKRAERAVDEDDEDEDEDNEDDDDDTGLSIFDEDDDDDNDDEDDEDDVFAELDIDEDDEDEEGEARRIFSLAELRARSVLSRIRLKLSLFGKFENEDNKGYRCRLGMTYPDDTEMQLRLFCQEKVRLSDAGLTIEYLKRQGQYDDLQVRKVMQGVFEDYALTQDMKTGEIMVKIDDPDCAAVALLCLFAAIEKIVRIPSSELVEDLHQELTVRSREALAEIIFKENATYDKALDIARENVDELKDSQSTLDKTVAENVLSAVEDMDDVTYYVLQQRGFF